MASLTARIESLVASQDASEREKHLRKFKTDVKERKINLNSIISNLEDYLTSTDDTIRERGMELVVETLRVDLDVTQSDRGSFVKFFHSKIDDHACVSQALTALLLLVNSPQFPSSAATQTAVCILKQARVQSLPIRMRKTALNAIRSLCLLYSSAMIKMGSEFPKDFIDVMDGEKDPRCLQICLWIVAFIGRNFQDLPNPIVEDLFDVTSCYFPITFKAPKNDPFGISGEDIKTALTDALSSSPQFVKYVIDFVIEVNEEGKEGNTVDALDILSTCVSTYSSEMLGPHLDRLRKFFHELFMSISSPIVLSRASKALGSVVKILRPDTVGGFVVKGVKSYWEVFMGPLLKQHSDRIAESSGSRLVLVAIANSTKSAFSDVFAHVCPLISAQIKSSQSSPTHRENLTTLALHLVKIRRDMDMSTSQLDEEKDPFMRTRQELYLNFSAGLNGGYPAQREACCRGLAHLLSIESLNMWTQKETQSGLLSLVHVLLGDDTSEVRESSLEAILSLSDGLISEVNNVILGELVNVAMERHDDVRVRIDRKEIFENIKKISTHPSSVSFVFKALTHYALSKLDPDSKDPSILIPLSALSFISKHCDVPPVSHPAGSLLTNALLKCVEKAFEICNGSIKSLPLWKELVKITCDFAKTTLRKVSVEEQLRFFRVVSPKFLGRKKKSRNIFSAAQFQPLYLDLIRIFCTCIANLNRTIEPAETRHLCLQVLIPFALNSKTPVESLESCIGVIVNKMDAKEVNEFVRKDMGSLVTKAQKGNKNAIRVLTWIVKGLGWRGHKAFSSLLLEITSIMDTDAGRTAADGFEVILSEKGFKDAFGLKKSKFYKQKLYLTTLPKLVEISPDHKTRSKVTSSYAMVALAHIFALIPTNIYEKDIETLSGCIVYHFMTVENGRSGSIMALGSVISKCHQNIAKNIDSLVPILLEFTMFKTSKKIRIIALQCLMEITKLPYNTIHRHKTDIINHLANALDDNKREVRAVAVKCRGAWFTLKS